MAEPLIVDVMNVVGSRPDRWWRDRRAAIARMLEALERYAADSGEQVVAVVDGDAPRDAPVRRGVEVIWAGRGRDAADREIVRTLAEKAGTPQRIVTSDSQLAEHAAELGAEVLPAGAFRRRLELLLQPKD